MPALALTDHGNLFGALEFYEHAVCLGIKPIIGEEFYLAPTSMRDRNVREKPFHLVLLAKDEEGYRNLLSLSSLAYLDGFYYKPRIDKTLLEKHAKGIVGMSSCLGGEIPVLLATGREEEARARAGDYLSIFGREDFYFELMNNGLKEQAEVNRALVRLSAELGVKLVATNDIHYLEKEDAEYHDVLLCIQTGKSVNETKRLKFRSEEFYFKSPEDMRSLFAEVPDALRSTLEITEKCNLSLDLGTFHLPHFPIPEGESAESYLEKLTEEGIARRYGTKAAPDSVRVRARRELEVIKSMGFSTYFLIVWDFIQFAKKRCISVGPGRGSAAGSIVAYALGITDVDPLKYGLLFERFLNPSRISMPDIDIDFDGERRDEVIGYVREKYGNDRVAQIITFGAMKARAVVRDVARAMEIDLKEADAIAKMIPSRIDITIEEALKSSKELSEMVQRRKDVETLFAISRGLEKLVRHPSTHAAGVVISPVPLTNIVPLYKDPKSGVISTQYQAKYLEHVGLIKMDFLGLKNLTVIERCLASLKKSGQDVPEMANLDLEDRDVYALLSAGKSMGVFQLESSGMQNLLKRLGPNCFDDVIAVLALYRPGPLDSGMVDEFIERKNGRKPIVYAEPVLEPILKETHGVIVYQEQVMEIARAISGFSMAEADNLRKAIGKKKPELLEEQREKFIDGAVKEKVSRKSAEEIFELIKTFGRYGFNKSHSTAYALLAFQTAYLKAHYPVHYLAALLSGELHDTDKIAQYIQEAREMGIPLHPPDINRSGVLFEVDSVDGREGRGLSYALAAVKNVGEGAARSIVDERARGPYASLLDFTSRIDLRLVNKRVMESLVKCGAMDCFGETRSTLFANIDGVMEYGASRQGDRLKGQNSLFGESEEGLGEQEFFALQRLSEWDDAEKSEYEKEAMGFYFRSHPTAGFQDLAAQHGAMMIGELKRLPSESAVTVFGMIESLKKIVTKDGKEMAFLTIGDLTGSVEAVVFPSVYEKHSRHLQGKGVVVLSGRVSGEKVFADRIMSSEEFVKNSVSQIHVLLARSYTEDSLIRLRDIFLRNTGKCHVFIHVPELETQKKVVKVSGFLLVDPSEELIDRVRREGLAERVWVS
jgi:DNA polymerase-3 subunit alpha